MKPTTFNRKRVVFALLVFLLIISPLLPLDRAGRSATVTADGDGPAQPAAVSIFTNPAPIIIPDFGVASPSMIDVTGVPGVVTQLRVTLTNVTHPNPDDLDILLIGPQGQNIILMSDAGGADDLNNRTFSFVAAGQPLFDDSFPAIANFRPANYDGGSLDNFPPPAPPPPHGNPGPQDGGTDTLISVFNNTNPNGTWSLTVVDDTAGNSGSIAGGWGLTITSGQIVTNLFDSGPGSLRQAIADALPGDTVFFAQDLNGTITLTSELVIDKNLIIGGPGNDVITISGNDVARVFNIQAGASVIIGDVTIADGNADNDPGNSLGGGILNAGNLALSQARVTNNTASDGGGIATIGNGRVAITNSTITGNFATSGAGLFIDSTNATASTIFGSTFSDNSAFSGGGIFANTGTLNITTSTISGNSAFDGGGIFNSAGTLTINVSTIVSNEATGGSGGGMSNTTGGVISIRNTIIDGNTAPAGPDATGTVTSQGFNFVSNNSGATITAMTGDQIGTAAAPLDANLTPLQDNGGPTLTHMPIFSSLVINAGSNAGAPTADQRGLPRNLGGPVIDIGATEFFTRRPTNLEITNLSLGFGGIGVTARLTRADNGNPIPGRAVSFVVGFGSVSAVTDINGVARVLEQIGMGIIISGTSASFPGDAEYESSLASRSIGYSGQGSGPQGGGDFLIFNADESYAANEGAGAFNIRTFPQDSNWTAVANDPWIQITSGSSGTGDAVVSYTVAANTGPTPRTGTITAAGLTFTVLQGAAFTDVPESHPFYTFIGKLSARSVTLGCNTGLYCPDDVVTRQQMAAFIIRALGDFNPPEPAMQRFDDVPPANPFYRFIDQMAIRQITLGCTPTMYCPLDVVTRQQMAAFIVRALGEPNPPAPFVQRFTDVPVSSFFSRFIERMAVRRITLGCAANMYCPEDSVTRGQMAAFLVRAFGL